ncbi:hypothetical protein IWX49DRAFT_628543 [Phyllosticta citricarpa]
MPGEVRNEIYKYLLLYSDVDRYMIWRCIWIKARLARGLLLANKRLHEESVSLLFSQNTVDLHWTELKSLVLRKSIEASSIQSLELQYLELDFRFDRPPTTDSPHRLIGVIKSLMSLRFMHIHELNVKFYDHLPGARRFIYDDCFVDWTKHRQSAMVPTFHTSETLGLPAANSRLLSFPFYARITTMPSFPAEPRSQNYQEASLNFSVSLQRQLKLVGNNYASRSSRHLLPRQSLAEHAGQTRSKIRRPQELKERTGQARALHFLDSLAG